MTKRRGKRSRSDAAKRGWITRRKHERERERKRQQRRERDARRRRDRRGGGGVVPPAEPPKPPTDRGAPPIDYDEPLDDLPSDEWEIGFEYRGASGAHSFVDINFRIARENGEVFSKAEAENVLAVFLEHLLNTGNPEIPAGYMMAGIDWHRPRWGSKFRTGDDFDFENFRDPMRYEADNPSAWNVRLGSVKS